MSPQTETTTKSGFKAGVKDYRLTYYTPDYQVADTDILAAFRMTPQPGVPAVWILKIPNNPSYILIILLG